MWLMDAQAVPHTVPAEDAIHHALRWKKREGNALDGHTGRTQNGAWMRVVSSTGRTMSTGSGRGSGERKQPSLGPRLL